MNGVSKMHQKKITLLLTFFLYITVNAAESFTYEHQSETCGVSHISKTEGRITSPNYPRPYPNYTSCTWMITNPTRHFLTLRLTDLDIEEDDICDTPSCCSKNWLSMPSGAGETKVKFCGKLKHLQTVRVSQPHTVIKFHSSAVNKGGRGFMITFDTVEPIYSGCTHCPTGPIGRCVTDVARCKMFSCIGKKDSACRGDEFQCFNETQRCNGFRDCVTGKDEENCPQLNRCAVNDFPCRSGQGCYSYSQICDQKPDCLDGSDEENCADVCSGKHKCSDGKGCYSSIERCDAVQNCMDNSDEEYCYRRFQCDDGNYIPHSQWCDGLDNCKDGSDEQGCIKNSVIAAAIMGSLLCSLLLVIAVGCMCRLYSLRLAVTNSYRIHHNSGNFGSQPPVPHLDEEFFNREPPPAYSVAVSGCSLQCGATQPNSRLYAAEHTIQRHQHSNRRPMRRHSNRRRSQRNLIVGVPSHCDPSVAVSMQPQGITANYAGLTINQLPVLSHSAGSIPGGNDAVSAQQGEAILTSENANNKINDTDCSVSHPNRLASVQGGESRPPHVLYETCILSVPITQANTESISPSHSYFTSSSSSSSSESPSRNSVTSSTSLLSYLSGDEDEQLLVIPAS